MWSLILHILGVEPRQTSTAYNFWSGFGSDVAEFAILGAAWHVLNCHEEGCLRVARHTQIDDAGHHIRRCAKHHRAIVQPPVA